MNHNSAPAVTDASHGHVLTMEAAHTKWLNSIEMSNPSATMRLASFWIHNRMEGIEGITADMYSTVGSN